jgi:hypothetical protein
MKRVNKYLLAAILLSIFGTTLFSQTNSFYVYFKQGDKRINILENKVELKKEPFQIYIEYLTPADIYVNAATEGQTYRFALAGKLMSQIPGFATNIKTESFFLNKEIINLSDERYCVWYKTDTHGEQNMKTPDGRYICYRSIKKLYLIKEKRIFNIQDFEKDIYMVFIYTEKENSGEQLEVQRELVKINWVNLYEENTKTYLRQKKIEDKSKINRAKNDLKRKQRLEEKEVNALKKLEENKIKRDEKMKKEAEKKAEKDKKKTKNEGSSDRSDSLPGCI